MIQPKSSDTIFNFMAQEDNPVNVKLSTHVRGLQLFWDSFGDINIV